MIIIMMILKTHLLSDTPSRKAWKTVSPVIINTRYLLRNVIILLLIYISFSEDNILKLQMNEPLYWRRKSGEVLWRKHVSRENPKQPVGWSVSWLDLTVEVKTRRWVLERNLHPGKWIDQRVRALSSDALASCNEKFTVTQIKPKCTSAHYSVTSHSTFSTLSFSTDYILFTSDVSV